MNKISTLNMTRPQWLKIRQNSIGGSDSGVILGLSEYVHPARLFAEKAGLMEAREAGDAAFFGTVLEDTIANLMKYAPIVDGQVYMDGLKANFENKLPVRSVKNCNYILYHKDYPFISGNLDRVITDDTHEGKGILECKTISGWVADKWEVGIPPQYFAQLQHYLAVTGYTWGMIAVLMDGRELKVFEFTRDDKLIEGMIEAERKFWERVVKARELAESGLIQEAWQYAPSDDEDGQAPNPYAYEAFLKERYKDAGLVIAGSDEDFSRATRIKEIDAQMKELDREKQTLVNGLKEAMGEAQKMEFDEHNYCSWKENAKGVRVFTIKFLKSCWEQLYKRAN